MLQLICCLVVFAVLAALVIHLLRKKQTRAERAAVVAIADYTQELAEADRERVRRLKAELERTLAAHAEAVRRIRVAGGQNLRAKVDAVVDKQFLHAAYKGAARKKWKQEFEEKSRHAVNEVLQMKSLEPALKDAVRVALEECDRKGRDFRSITPRAVPVPRLSPEASLGLARLLADEERRRRFLGDAPPLHDAAKSLFRAAPPPSGDLFERLRSARLSPREILAAFESPARVYERAKTFVQDVSSQPFGVHDIIIDAALVVGLLDVAFHLTTGGPEGIVMLAMHVLAANNAVFLEIIFHMIKDLIVEQFGDAAWNEFLALAADAMTGVIIITSIWRGYRYYKLAKKLARFWNGDDVIPGMRDKFLEACDEILEKIAEQAVGQVERRIEGVVNDLNARIQQVCDQALARRAWALSH